MVTLIANSLLGLSLRMNFTGNPSILHPNGALPRRKMPLLCPAQRSSNDICALAVRLLRAFLRFIDSLNNSTGISLQIISILSTLALLALSAKPRSR
eukprot:10058706-Heterocapsa_arctica.AAC.1